MYWYLSFLRPPPTAAPAGGSITITPQIANDLRTELKYDPTDIYYTWQLQPSSLTVDPSSTSTSYLAATSPITSPPVLLTRWDPPMTTYRPLSIPLPPHALPGQHWRLGLSTPAPALALAPASAPTPRAGAPVPAPTNTGAELLQDGCGVLGVWSEGIRITPSAGESSASGQGFKVNGHGHASKKVKHLHSHGSKAQPKGSRGKGEDGGSGAGAGARGREEEGGKGAGKQTRIVREFRFDCSSSEPPSASNPNQGYCPMSACPPALLRIIEQTSFDLDKKVWDSGLALGAWLWRGLVNDAAGTLSGPATQISTTAMPSASSSRSQPPSSDAAGLSREVLHRCEGKGRIVELGSGTGLVGIMLDLALRHRAGVAATAPGVGPGEAAGDEGEKDAGGDCDSLGRIIATDLPSAIELMQENIALNLPSPSSTPVSTSAMPSPTMLYNASSASNAPGTQARTSTVKARVLDWDSPLPGWVGEASWPSLIIAADVTYNTSSFPSLLSTLIALLHPTPTSAFTQPTATGSGNSSHPGVQGVTTDQTVPSVEPHLAPHLEPLADASERPLLLLAYKERDPAERDLWQMLREKGVEMVLVDRVQGAEERGETEIWVGRYVGADAA